jgi:hypothetical protein
LSPSQKFFVETCGWLSALFGESSDTLKEKLQMIGAIFIITQKGDVLLTKLYRDDIRYSFFTILIGCCFFNKITLVGHFRFHFFGLILFEPVYVPLI